MSYQDLVSDQDIDKLITSCNQSIQSLQKYLASFSIAVVYCYVALLELVDPVLLAKDSRMTLPIVATKVKAAPFMGLAGVLILVLHLGVLERFFVVSRHIHHLRSLIGGRLDGMDMTRRVLLVLDLTTEHLSRDPKLPRPLINISYSVFFLVFIALPQYVLSKLTIYQVTLGRHDQLPVLGLLLLDLGLIALFIPLSYSPDGNWRRWFDSTKAGLAGKTVLLRRFEILFFVCWLAFIGLFGYSLVREGCDDSLLGNFRDRFGSEFRNWAGREIGEAHDFEGWNLRCADFSGAKLRKSTFKGSNLNGANFSEADLDEVRFIESAMEGVSFQAASLRKIDFSSSRLVNAHFEEAVLEEATFKDIGDSSFSKARLVDVTFSEADLHLSSFYGATIMATSFKDANLLGADFGNAELCFSQLGARETFGSNLALAILTKVPDLEVEGISLRSATLVGACEPALRGSSLDLADLRDLELATVDLKSCLMPAPAAVFSSDLRGVLQSTIPPIPPPQLYRGWPDFIRRPGSLRPSDQAYAAILLLRTKYGFRDGDNADFREAITDDDLAWAWGLGITKEEVCAQNSDPPSCVGVVQRQRDLESH